MKSFLIRSFSGSYFPAFELKMERYSEYGHFSRSEDLAVYIPIPSITNDFNHDNLLLHQINDKLRSTKFFESDRDITKLTKYFLLIFGLFHFTTIGGTSINLVANT